MCIEDGADIELAKAQAVLDEVKATIPLGRAQGDPRADEFEKRIEKLQGTIDMIRDECIETVEVEVKEE